MSQKTITNLISVGIIVVLAVIVLLSSFTIVPTGYTGVRVKFGQVSDKPVVNGFVAKVPFVESIQKVDNRQQRLEINSKIWGETKERTPVYYENIAVIYCISPEFSAWIYSNISNYEKTLITEDIIASAIKDSSKTLADADATTRDKIEHLALDALQKSLDEKFGDNKVVIINKITIGNADFEDSYNNALVAKQQAQIDYEKQAVDNQKAIEKAEADAKVQLTKAKAAADAAVIEAEGKKQANEKMQKSLTDAILEQQRIEKWDGKYPEVVSGDSGLILDISGSNSK